MDDNNKKILTISFRGAAVVAAVVVHILMGAVMAISGSATRYLSSDLVANGVPFLVGFATFLGLQFTPAAVAWGNEVVTEVKRAVWPSGRDTLAMTIAVIVMILISAGLLGIFDVLSSKVVNLLVTWR
jgi:preprotein translocase subunit SecE